MAQAVEHLPRKLEVLSSTPSTGKKKKSASELRDPSPGAIRSFWRMENSFCQKGWLQVDVGFE
jgi:hypothetical protein